MSENYLRELINRVNLGDRASGWELLQSLSTGKWKPSKTDGLNASGNPARIIGIRGVNPEAGEPVIAALVEHIAEQGQLTARFDPAHASESTKCTSEETIWKFSPIPPEHLAVAAVICGQVGIGVMLVAFDEGTCLGATDAQVEMRWLVSVSATRDIAWSKTDWADEADIIAVSGCEAPSGELLIAFLREQLPDRLVLPVIEGNGPSLDRIWRELLS